MGGAIPRSEYLDRGNRIFAVDPLTKVLPSKNDAGVVSKVFESLQHSLAVEKRAGFHKDTQIHNLIRLADRAQQAGDLA